LSIVFDARKHAERSKRAREAVARIPKSPDLGPPSSDAQDTAPPGEKSGVDAKREERAERAAAHDTCSTNSEASVSCRLGLNIERRAADWRLRWNQGAVANATGGRLTITNGAIHKQFNLGVSELQDGSIIYSPGTDDVVIRLEILTPESPTPLSESVRLVADAKAVHARRAAATEQDAAARVARSNGAWAIGTGVGKCRVAEPAPIVRSLLRAGRSASLADNPAHDFAPDVSRIEPAALISRKDPAYPDSARQDLVSGSVEVHFRISPEGKVYDAKPVTGPPSLARAAIEAVEAWCYEPARLYGAPVDSQASTNVDFKLNCGSS
jgi:TonB family protein